MNPAEYITLDELDAEIATPTLPTPDEVVEALRHFVNEYSDEDPEKSEEMIDRLIATVRELSWAVAHSSDSHADWQRWDDAVTVAEAVEEMDHE